MNDRLLHNSRAKRHLMRRRGRELGVAMVEFALFIPIALMIVGSIIDTGLALSAANSVSSATREGARVAAALSNVTADDARVRDEVMLRLQDVAFLSINPASDISNTDPGASGGVLTNSSGQECDHEVTVTVDATYNSVMLSVVGASSISISRSTTMRHHNGELCDI